MRLQMKVEVAPTADKLQRNNAIAEHICFLCQLSSHCILRGQVTSAAIRVIRVLKNEFASLYLDLAARMFVDATLRIYYS